MKTKTGMIIGILLVLSLTIISATSFSPSSLTFNLEKNEEKCETVYIESSSEITISDKWAENKDIEWDFSLFETSASEHGIIMDYEFLDENNIEICLSGINSGEYHGVLLLREEQEGNSIIQIGIWLKLIINEQENQEDEKEIDNQNNVNNNVENPVSGGGGASVDDEVLIEGEPEAGDFELEELAEPKIQGSVTGSSSKGTISIIVIVLAAIIIAGVIVYKKKSQNNVNMENMGVENV